MILGNGSTNGEGHTLLVSGGDGILSVLDLRSTGGRKLLGKSAFQEDELQSLCLVRGGTKVCVGTQSGTILIFSYGQWGDHTDRFPGHPESISTLATDGQRRLFTGDDAGVIRECSVMPHSVQRTIGKHRHVVSTDENGCIAKEDKGDLPAVERLCLSGNGEFLASCSTQGSIRFWSTSTASVASSDKNKDRNNDDSDTEDDEEEEVERRRPKKVKLKQAFKKSDQRGAHSDFFSDLA